MAIKFYSEHNRSPSKEELEHLALEMVFNIRPYAEDFLAKMSQLYELVVFTAGEQDYADEILDTLDPEGYISHRLYRQHTVPAKDEESGVTKHYMKDLVKLGRPLETTIIIDNIKENFSGQPRNGIQILTWKNDPYDSELLYYQRLLLNMARSGATDLRDKLDRLRQEGLLNEQPSDFVYEESSSLLPPQLDSDFLAAAA